MDSRPHAHRLPDSAPPGSAARAEYRTGLHRLLAGQPDATGPLNHAVSLLPRLAVAHIALACAHDLNGNTDLAATSAKAARAELAGATRRDRQHVEILAGLIHGKVSHAIDLAFEHICEFGTDLLVVHQLACRVHRDRQPSLTAHLRALTERLRPRETAGPVDLGVLAWALAVVDDSDQAIALAEQALRADPANTTAAQALALAAPAEPASGPRSIGS